MSNDQVPPEHEGAGPRVLTSTEIEGLVAAGRELDLIGLSETGQLDFKQQPHLLGNDKGKWELAKDVAALANSGGGCLMIGVATEIRSDTDDEVASAITPFPEGMAVPQQIRATLDAASGVYPVIRGLRITRYEREDGRALMTIVVPEQDPDDQPFMVIRMVEGDEKRGLGVGVPYRSGPHTYWEPAGQIHRNLSDGLRFRRGAGNSLTNTGQTGRRDEDHFKAVAERLAEVEQYMGWSDAPTLMIAATPIQPQEAPIDGLYDPEKILGSIAAPPEIRYSGFGLGWSRQPENHEGSLINATAQRQILWVDPDGATFVACTAQQSFLTRSGGTREAAVPEPRKVNPTVLVEWTYLACLFVEQCIQPSVTGEMRLSIHLRGATSRPWTLTLASGITSEFWSDGHSAGMDDLDFATTMTGDAAADAFRLLRRFYAVFGFGDDAIPYIADGKVNPDDLRAIS